ncbi:MAG TPA: MFS transporter [Usitatibacter sp.]|nr:MFS transporter [Usitatibacter sp.]
MAIYLACLLSFLQGIALRGAKMQVSLAALAQGASSFEVGLIGAMFPVFPLLLAVYAGKASDRIGMRPPMIGGALVMCAGIAIPLAWPGIPGLVASAACVGLGQIFFHVSVHNLIGAFGEGEARTRNFATFSLGQSLSAFFGPSITGFSIDGWGYGRTYVLLAAICAAPAVILLLRPSIVPARARPAHEEASGGSLALFRIPALRRTLLMSGVTLTGIELFTFYFPVYGRAIGLTASAIGLVMSSYAVAAFIVRLGMHRASRRLGELGVLTASLFMAGATYLLVPMVSHAVLLAVAAFLLGIGLGCAQPLTILLTYNHAPRGRSGEALGLRITVNKLTQIAVPVVFGGLGSVFGLLPVFWANGAFLLAGGFLSLAERQGGASRIAARRLAIQQEKEEA